MNANIQNFQELRPRIIVMGVGGAGGNAVNNMIASGLEGVEFVAANTDAQALSMSGADIRLQIGVNITEGLGAGSNPEIGESAAEEAMDDLKQLLEGAHMLFIACGMGGGTGTGAAPVVARMAQSLGVLTVAVVTKPFQFEGQRRLRVAEAGIEQLRSHVDTMIVIPNQNLFRLANERTTFADSFRLADQVLNSGVACVTDLIMKEGLINLDFADVKTVITEMGAAVMGTGLAEGEGRAQRAAEEAISNPLIDDISLKGAKGLLISISGGQDMTLYEIDEVASRIRQEVDPNANIIVGATFDDNLSGYLRVSLVASGLNNAHPQSMHQEADQRRTEIENDAVQQKQPERLTERLRTVEGQQPAGVQQQQTQRPQLQGEQQPRVQVVNKKPRFMQGGIESIETNPNTPPSPHLDGRVTGREFVAGAPHAVNRPLRRMPSVDDLPLTGQQQLKAYEAPPANHGVVAQKKKVGFFERITGRGRSDEEEQRPDIEATDYQQRDEFEPIAPQRRSNPVLQSQQLHEQQVIVPQPEVREENSYPATEKSQEETLGGKEPNIDEGPSSIAQKPLQDGEMPQAGGLPHGERYENIEINRHHAQELTPLEEDDSIADIPPFLRKTNHNR